MYEFIRDARHQRWDKGNGPWSVNRWLYEHLGLALGGLVALAVVLRLADGRVGFFDLLWIVSMVAVPYSILRLEARAYSEWEGSNSDVSR